MEKMTQQQAVEILNSDSFINYSEDEILEAVELLKSDVTQKDLLEKFYKKYNAYLDSIPADFGQYPTIKQIFADTEYAEKLQKDANDRANRVAVVINSGEEPSSFKDINNIQALFSFAEKTPDIENASAKLEKVADYKIDAMIIDSDFVDIFDLPYAQKLVDDIKDEDKRSQAQEKLNKVLEDYKEENGLNASNEVMRKNDSSLDEELKNINLYNEDNSISEDFADLKELVENIEVKDDESNEETNLDAEKTSQHINMLFEAAKLEAYQESVGSLKYLMASRKEQKEQLAAKIKDHFIAKVAQAGIASSFEAPSVEEQQDENKFKAYIERREKAAKEFIDDVINTGKKVTIKVKDIISACAETDINVSKFKEVLEASMGRSKLNKHLKNFRNAAVGLWGKRYEIARGIVKNIKENKWQHITNTAATLAVGLTTVYASGAAAAAIGAYAVYSAAGNYVWPVIAEAQKMREKAKEKNQKLGFWQSLKDAYNVKKDDADYKRKGRWGLVGGAVGAVCGFGATSFGLETVAARGFATIARTISTSTAQLSTLLAAKRDFKKDPSDSNRSKLRSARISFGVGATMSGIFSVLSINRMAESSALSDIKTDESTWSFKDLFNKETNDSIVEASEVTPAESRESKWSFKWLFNKKDANTGPDVDNVVAVSETPVAETVSEEGRKPKWKINWLFNKEDTNSEADIRVPYAPEEATDDLSSVDTSATDNTATETTVSETPVAEEVSQTPKVGDVLLRKEHQNGIVETQVMGKNGNIYQQVEGLKGGTETSASVQSFYEHRIKNMNQYNHLVEVMANKDGSKMTANDAVAAMQKQIAAGFVTLPEGVTPEHAIHTAFMHAHYHYVIDPVIGELVNDTSAIDALLCPNGEDTEIMFAQLVHKYSTDNGFIGRPVDPDYQAIMKAGTVTIKQPCEVTEHTPVSLQDVPVAPSPTVVENMSVTWASEPAATVEYPAAMTGANTYPCVGDEGFEINAVDSGNNILTAKETLAREGVEGYKMVDGDRVELVHTRNGGESSSQTQRYFNVVDGYNAPLASDVNKYAEELGGEVDALIASTKDGKTTYHYVGSNGVVVSFDPDNKYAATITSLAEDRAPIAEQKTTLAQAVAALKKQQGEGLEIKAVEDAPQSSLTVVRVKDKGGFRSIFARFSSIRGK